MQLIPYDHVVTDVVTYDKNKHIEIVNDPVTLDQYIDTIINEIYQSVSGKQCWIAESAGLDCNVITAVMDYFNIDYHTFNYTGERSLHPEWYQNVQNRHWGFNQTPYFDKPVNIVTGMYGDEYLLRNPYYVEQHLKIDMVNLFEKLPNCYMYEFFMDNYKKKMNKGYRNDWLQILLNDYQLWSIAHITVINPYKSKKILMQGLSLDNDSIIKQVTDGFISKKIIQRTNPSRLAKLDQYKNDSDDVRLYSTNN